MFSRWVDILTLTFKNESFSNIEKEVNKFRRAVALGIASDQELIEEFIKSRISLLERTEKLEVALSLSKETKLSQHSISDITGVSRDTIRKHRASEGTVA